MRGNEVEEISCTHEEDVYSSADQLFEGYGNNATDPIYPGNSHSSSGEVDMKIEGDAQADVTTNFLSEKIFRPNETRKIYLVQPADVASRRSSFGCDRTESPNENESSYDTDANLERKDAPDRRPVANPATFLLSDLEEKSETGQLYEHYTNYSAMQVLDKQCQVELLQENFRKYESRESQTSFLNGATNKECQTNMVSDLPNLRGTLQNQSIECQTEVPTNCCVKCGGIVQSFDFQDKLSMECRYTNRESRTISEDGNISTSTKQCQTSPSSEDLSQLLFHQSSATIIGSKAVREISFESKGCQTSEKCLLLSTSGAEVFQVLRSHHQVDVSDKEMQTSSDVVLVSSSAQCDILPFTCVGELAARVNETSRLVSFATKECQTVHDLELLLATSKHCQTFSFETTSAGNESKPTIVSKGCQTLPVGRTESKECQTMDEIALDIADVTRSSKGDQSISHTSVECQTISDSITELYHPLWDRSETMKVVGDEPRNKSSDPLNRNELTISCENKGSQTKPERVILLTSSKLCQTTTLDTAVACENKESQTQLDDEILLILSKACQTTPFGLDDTDSKSSIDGPIGSQDFELSLAASSEPQLEISSPSNQMASRHRPATYGKSPDTTEESFMEFQLFHGMDETDLCKSKAVEPLSPVGSSVVVDFSDKGCQAMLCDCGNCAEQHPLVSNSTEVSSDLERGAAMRVSEGMQKEQASLIKQLDMLRDMNQKLRDDKDAIEAAHQAMLMAKKERGYGSLSDEIEEAEKKTKVSRQGSQMSKYVRKRRTPGAEDTWGNQGSVGSLSEEEVDGPNSDSARPPARRRSKRRDMKKQGSVLHSYFPNTGSGSQSSVSLPDSIREEAEFDGDPTLELISDEKLKEDERPAWAQKILSCVQPKELVEEEREDSQMRASDEELEEDVFRTRKTELISGAATNKIKKGKDDSDMSYSEGMSGETGSETDDRPNSPRAAPVGKDNEMSRVGSQDMSEAGVSAVSEHATPERVFKVVFVGDSGVGKSSFIHRFCHDAWRPSFTATIGVDFQIKTMNIDGRCIALQLWDTAGQERFRSITKQYFRKADGVIVFYDITMETSFLNIKNWMISVEEGTDDGTAIMIVGNKIDLVEDDTHRAVQSQEGKKLAEEYKALYSETSAKTGYNIPESMAEFSKMLQVRKDELMQSVLNLVESLESSLSY
ncbi:uncharacterized protein LOC111340572 isoform X2 [Stylophora pistillata]|uniref:uncharacterized protein LOC111340572 isoform X2 n=1 Tax=Stylophora pistillata TaxID=50429 RepID=UPI000C054307|nr:uncharacterized protein LOC111340572 isoform X2 [Stylophora pistillata]